MAEARAGRIWQPVHDGGVSTKIINPQATEGGGSVVGFWGGDEKREKRDTARLGIVGVGDGVGEGEYRGEK